MEILAILLLLGISLELALIVFWFSLALIFHLNYKISIAIAFFALLGSSTLLLFSNNLSLSIEFTAYAYPFIVIGLALGLVGFVFTKKFKFKEEKTAEEKKEETSKNEKNSEKMSLYYSFLVFPTIIIILTVLCFIFIGPLLQPKIEKAIFALKSDFQDVSMDLISTVTIVKASKDNEKEESFTKKIEQNNSEFFIAKVEELSNFLDKTELKYRPNRREEALSLLRTLGLKKADLEMVEDENLTSDLCLFIGEGNLLKHSEINLRIDIRNASSIEGLAARVANQLEDKGYSNITIGNTFGSSDYATKVVYPPDFYKEAKEIVEDLDREDVDFEQSKENSDIITIILYRE